MKSRFFFLKRKEKHTVGSCQHRSSEHREMWMCMEAARVGRGLLVAPPLELEPLPRNSKELVTLWHGCCWCQVTRHILLCKKGECSTPSPPARAAPTSPVAANTSVYKASVNNGPGTVLREVTDPGESKGHLLTRAIFTSWCRGTLAACCRERVILCPGSHGAYWGLRLVDLSTPVSRSPMQLQQGLGFFCTGWFLQMFSCMLGLVFQGREVQTWTDFYT